MITAPGESLTTGGRNVAVGMFAMQVHTTGDSNIAIGDGAMDDTNAGSTAQGSEDNIFMGYTAGGGTWADAASKHFPNTSSIDPPAITYCPTRSPAR